MSCVRLTNAELIKGRRMTGSVQHNITRGILTPGFPMIINNN